ncbi:uncharacterized protein M8220_012692 isoform 2-T2 [Acridotheres tristis]
MAEKIPQPRGPGRPQGRMFPPRGPRRGHPRQPGPWWDGPCPPAGPEDTWAEPPWAEPPWADPPWGEPPWAEPPWAEPPWHEQPWDEQPWDEQPWNEPPPRHQRRRRRSRQPQPRPFPGPGDIPWKEEEEGNWAPHDCPPQPPWDDREFQGAEDGFGDGWHSDLMPDPWSEFPAEEQPPPWPPSGPPRNPPAFRGHCPPWSHRPAGRPILRRSHLRQLTLVPLDWCPRPPRGHKPHSKPSPAPSKRSQPVARKELQPPEPPQPPAALPGAAESPDQPQDVPVGSGGVLEPPSPAGSPLESPAAHLGAVEPLVELGAGQTPVGSQEQDPRALGTDPAPLEETSRCPEIQEHPEAEPCSPAVPKAGSGHGSHPQSPAAPPDPAKRELLESSSSGEAGAELSPHSWEQPPRGAGEAEAEAAQDGSLRSPENPQVAPGCAAEPKAQPSQASPGACRDPETSQHPPSSGETNPAVSGQHQRCSMLPSPFPAGIDFRSAAVLAKKAEIELSYQQFSLTIAVVATMLLQKEPSMEAALGVALRANLRQCRIHHLQQLEDFIDTIDSL